MFNMIIRQTVFETSNASLQYTTGAAATTFVVNAPENKLCKINKKYYRTL